ncbi:hypothetical protein OIU80_05565 [Flavobacterium sp. LS1R47]|uniref:Uncharacterized protein n=1 Tax=Flavobacterium frigoritolerans TaxID=2987686 RepID=A0A9X2YZI5_9FLAO|nr:hypothetical protein [Flavobacterium frigoritolerans]MCV9931744.1 hypothetical protein [Flavobacterium frigoritolerans]
MPTTPTDYKYYPALSDLIKPEDLPDFLSFIKDGLRGVFDKMYYKDYQTSKSTTGSSAFYSLDIVSRKKLEFELPGTGAFFVLNPDYEDRTISSFPITLFWEWEVMRYIRYFNANGFSFSVEDFYDLGLTVLKISEEQIIQLAINTFVVQSNPALSKFGQLVQDINTLYGTAIAIDETSSNSLQELIVQVSLLDKKIAPAIFSLYLLSTDLSETKAKIKTFFSSFIPDDIEEYIKKIITPKARVTLELSAAIEFPRKILLPWKNNGTERDEDETHLAKFQFAKAILYADTQAGIGYSLELAGTLSPKFCEIGRSGMLIQIESLKLDLSKKTNILEADADGRPNDFVGVYARAISVTLPSRWFNDDKKEIGNTVPTLKIGASDLLIGTGGLSGNIYLETVPVPTGNGLSYFNDKFDFLYPITMFETGKEDKVVKEKEIVNYTALIQHLEELDTLKLPCAFKYPLVLKTNADLLSALVRPNTIYSFNTAKEYQDFLSKLIENTLWKTIGSPSNGFKIGFNKFDISFKQNKVIGSNIKGQLILNKLKKPDGRTPFSAVLEGHLYDDGDFNLTASFEKESAPTATLFNLVQFDFFSFELGKQDEDFYVGTSCYVSFPNPIMNKIMQGQGIDIEKLRIYSDGNIEVEGGSIPIPLNRTLDLGAVKMTISNVNFGSTQINGRKYNFWGFDGAISINPLGVDARGEGVKYYYCTEEGHKDDFLRIQTIEVDLIIPGSASKSSAMAIINGMISLPQPGVSQEFTGEVSLKLPKAKISGGVGMRFMPKYPAFLVDAHVDLPTPIPLGFLSISAFRGLLGYRYVATKEAAGLTKDKSWYEYYKHPKPGINLKKFTGPPDSLEYDSPFSIGAGATFGTVADGGHVLSLRAMMLLSLPTLFYIEAGLNVIAGRLGLIEDDPSNPPFFAMVAFGDDSLELAAGADFSIPKDGGEIFKLHALLEAGFFFKNQKPWYVNIGSRKDPIEARILTLFSAKAFIMLSAQGIEAGARLEYKVDKSFGPARVKMWAYLELGGKISFKRPQMGGYIAAGGGIQIKIWIVKVEIGLDTMFSIESFKPFLIYAEIQLSVRVKIGFIKVRKKFTIELKWDINRIIDRTPYSPLPMGTHGDAQDNRTSESVKGVHMLTNQAFPLNYFSTIPNGNDITEIIPLDTFIDIKMAKGLLPNPDLKTKIGGFTGDAKNYTDLMPPESTSRSGKPLRQVKHQYSIKSIGLKSWNSTSNKWEDYHPFEAVVEQKDREKVGKLPWAQWQKVIDQYDSIRVLATNPFSFLSAGEPGWYVPEQYGITPSKLFCKSDEIKREHIDFFNKRIGKRFYTPMQYEAEKINGLFFKLIGDLSDVVEKNKLEGGDFMTITGENNPFGYRKSLSFKNYNQLEIIFPKSAIEPTLQLTTRAKDVKIVAYTAIIDEKTNLIKYEKISLKKSPFETTISEELTYSKEELRIGITLYDANSDPISKTKIDKIVIIPLSANTERILEIRNELAALFDKTYTDAEGVISISFPSDMPKYNSLLAELTQLRINAGNSTPIGTPTTRSFTRFYGYKGKAVYAFDKVFKFNNTYLISFHPQPNTTVIVQIDINGRVLRERLLNGVVTSMQVVNGNLFLTQGMDAKQCKGIGEAIIDYDFVVGCQNPIASTAIIELDSELNQNFGMQYLNTYSIGFNKLLPLDNDELLWINTVTDGTQINWINGSDRTIIHRTKISEIAIKILQHSGTEFSLITKNKKIISISINTATKAITVTDTKVVSDASVTEITDAIIANDKILMSVKLTDGKFGLAQISGTAIKVVKNDTIFDSPIYLSNNTLTDNSILAYNEHYLFVFNSTLELTKLIKRDSTTDQASIITIQNDPVANEILMLSSRPNEKGIYFSLFNDLFDNCALYPIKKVEVTSSSLVLTNGTTSLIELNTDTNLSYTRGTRTSKLITVNSVICSRGSNTENEELEYTTFIQSIDWLTKESYFHNTTIPPFKAVEEDNIAMKDAIQNTVQPIWRANTTYCLDFELLDTVDDKNETSFKYYYGFKTLGPIGHFPVADPVTPAGQDPAPKNELTDLAKSPLTSLRQYIDYNRSYPNADGSLLQSKPVFYGNEQCEVSLFFTNPYAYHMFKDWENYETSRPRMAGALNLIIKDPLNDVLIPYPLQDEITKYPKVEKKEKGEEWVSDTDPRLPLGIKLLNNFINSKPEMKCTLTLGDPLLPKSYGYSVKLTNLKPSKLYTILANNYFDTSQNLDENKGKNVLVHQFGFQTSRYRNFEEQVQSYEIGEKDNTGLVVKSRKALFDIKLNLSDDQIAALNNVIIGQEDALSDSMALKYQHSFDRAIEGILKLSPLDPAQSTEINRIIDTNTGDIVALLVRNPEPFNIPKMPLEEIKDTIIVGVPSIEMIDNKEVKKFTKNIEFEALYSKDYSQVLIMHKNKKITDNSLDIQFEYRMWNNKAKIEKGLIPLTLSIDKQSLHLEL